MDTPAQSHTTKARHGLAAGATVRLLKPRHAPAMLRHLLGLSQHDRYLRFGYIPTDEQIERFVAQLNHSECTLFGIFNKDLELVGLAQLSYIAVQHQANTAEFGVSVSTQCRGLGLGRLLFRRCIAHGRNQGVRHLIVHALSENARMIQMAKSAGASIQRDGGESMAHISLPPATLVTLLMTPVFNGLASADYHVKRYYHASIQLLRRMLAST